MQIICNFAVLLAVVHIKGGFSIVQESHPNLISADFPKQLDIAKVCVYGLSILSAGLFLFLPFFNLLHPSPWQRWMGTIHGFGALLTTVVAVYAGHLAFPLLRGVSKILPQMRTLTFWSTCLAFGAIASGNWAYMRYRAGLEFGGARAWLKENSKNLPVLTSNL